MIFTNKGNIAIDGSVEEIMADFSWICTKLKESNEIGKEKLDYAYNLGLKSDEELDKENQKISEEVNKLFEDLIKDLFGDIGK